MEKSALTFLILSLLLLPGQLSAQGKISAKKKSLEEINSQLEEKKREMDRYLQEEERITSELASIKKEEKQNTQRQRDLESQLSGVRSKNSESKQKYDSLEKSRKTILSDLYGQTVMYALDRDFYYPYYGSRDIHKSMFLKTAILEKNALLSKMKGESLKINQTIQDLSRRGSELKTKRDRLDKERLAQKRELKTKMGELEYTKGQYARLSREITELQNAALGLNKLVKKLEKQSPYKKTTSKDLPIPRHSLPWPAQGKVVSRFGKEQVPMLKTWIVREGIRIKTAAESAVFPVMNGKVIYSGPFRTFGNVVIVDHEQGFFTVYGLLSEMMVSKNDRVTPSLPLGKAGADTQNVGGGKEEDEGRAVYFEIRLGAEAVDPMAWLTN